MKKREDEPKKGAPVYMNTYGDMMTLLLTFFVLLFSMSTVDAEKFKALVSSFSASVSIFDGGQTIKTDTNVLENGMTHFPKKEDDFSPQQVQNQNAELARAEKDIQEYIEVKQIEDKVTVDKNGDTIVIRFADVTLFDTGKAQIKPGAIPNLNTIGEKLREYMALGYEIRVEGHTDNKPINTQQFPSNWELSSSRAIAVMRFYLEEMEFNPALISAEGRGEYHPISDNDTAEGCAENRRVEIKLSKPTS